jgi:hypothetical protein
MLNLEIDLGNVLRKRPRPTFGHVLPFRFAQRAKVTSLKVAFWCLRLESGIPSRGQTLRWREALKALGRNDGFVWVVAKSIARPNQSPSSRRLPDVLKTCEMGCLKTFDPMVDCSEN